MSASIELQRAAKRLMEASCAAASAEWMADAALKADLLAEAQNDIADAERAMKRAAPMLRRLGGGASVPGRASSPP